MSLALNDIRTRDLYSFLNTGNATSGTSVSTAAEETSSSTLSTTQASSTTNIFNQAIPTMASPNSGIENSVSEIAKIAQEIFSTAPVSQPAKTANSDLNLPKINLDIFSKPDTGIKVFGFEANANAAKVKQIANNQAGYNVTLSDKTLSAIGNLNNAAAMAQISDITNKMNGRIFIPAQSAQGSGADNLFSPGNTPKLFESNSTNKEKRGSNPFFVRPAKKETREKEERMNVLI